MMTMWIILTYTLVMMIPVIYCLQQRSFNAEREAWQAERRDLYNRIHAGSYTEYKAMEHKDKAEPEQPPEPPIEYV